MISEIRVRNFKCFNELDLPLGSFTLLTGQNSSGKSTILQSLILLRQSYLAGQLRQGRLVLNGDFVHLGTVDTTLSEDAGKDPTMELGLSWDTGDSSGFRFEVEGNDIFREFVIKNEYLDYAKTPTRPPFSNICFISAERLGPRTVFPTSELHVKHYREIGTKGEYAAHFLAIHGEELVEQSSLHFKGTNKAEAAASHKLRHEVEAWLGLLTPGVRIDSRYDSALETASLGFTFENKSLGLRTNEQRSTHVGFGLTYILPILIAVLSAKPGNLILIENPEAHLHPRAQREIVELLARAASCGIQIVVETHSDHVLNGARLAVKKKFIDNKSVLVHYFNNDSSSGHPILVSPEIQENGSISDWPQGFFDEWDNALDSLLS